MQADTSTRRRRALRVTGVVQGVGFRPFVARLARELEVVGFVGNDDRGVFIEIEGGVSTLDEFTRRLQSEAPPLAAIESLSEEQIHPRGEETFAIVASLDVGTGQSTNVPPDTVPCADCLVELADPSDRRYRYPFIACTNCGPRYTIVTGLPYDRPSTTMADFPLCAQCQSEYDDPSDRRFHAQPTACPLCGPRLFFRRSGGDIEDVSSDDSLALALEMLRGGGIVAIKGVGGYHLGVDAFDADAVLTLRQRKQRRRKPFALLVRDLGVARSLVRLSPDAERLLMSSAGPIVLAPIDADNESAVRLGDSVAPGNGFLGIMLATSPLQVLLMSEHPKVSGPGFDVLVMTSANLSDEPICTEVAEADERLAAIADGWLHHDRTIAAACDDSVVRDVGRSMMPIRRSRGYAPLPIRLPAPAPDSLAVGGELKTTLCVASGRRAVLSQHIGDTANFETLALLERTAGILLDITRTSPEVVIGDAHPGYLSARWARAYAASCGARYRSVQHHHAHLASLLVEHSVAPDEPALGVVFDGTGYGLDGTIWGGEFLLGSYSEVERIGHLKSVELPGGDVSIRQPWRAALAHIVARGLDQTEIIDAVIRASPAERGVAARMLATGTSCVPTTSMGRLFDAVASILDVCHEASYEGQAAIELESLAASSSRIDRPWHFDVDDTPDGIVLDPGPVITEAVRSVRGGLSARQGARAFHLALADAVVEVAHRVRARHGVNLVGLSGGVFQNALLGEALGERLGEDGFDVLRHRVVPANDGGLALGQVAVIASQGG
ncbi:MAG TPA: carbamoyltransferase HypF [Acidimicrobiales bacterium]|nr:carbamoyltransferase HypF [Acidimicrobiales bacterium]